ncbi:MAG: tetratricopeptide repeat protein [Spirochaetia bacterium]|jgi:tetratricopeptide (TPR) repeat protein|nr:tetratricopeptide repeat protein [Spirochaetia bacterium]
MSSKEVGAKSGSQASPKNEVKFSEKLNNFMYSYRTWFIGFGAVVLATVVGLGIWTVVSSSILKNSTIAIEELEKSFQEAGAADEGFDSTASQGLIEQADAIMAKYGKRYAAAKASIIKADILMASNDLVAAEKAYAASAESYPKSHIAPVALSNAASAAEDRGDAEAALTHLLKAETQYPGAPGADRITLSIGRIYEASKQYGKAMEAYARLIASGRESDWTKLAHTRIILLKSQGLAQ